MDRVLDYLVSETGEDFKGITEISPMAVAVITMGDHDEETDVYFDIGSYEMIHENIWRRGNNENLLLPEELQRFGLGKLPGLGRGSPVRGYVDALEFARQHLSPDLGGKFYKKPIGVE
jgi:hypothetical protein